MGRSPRHDTHNQSSTRAGLSRASGSVEVNTGKTDVQRVRQTLDRVSVEQGVGNTPEDGFVKLSAAGGPWFLGSRGAVPQPTL